MQSREIDAVIARLAARQHWIVAWWQLKQLGVSRHAVQHRVARGWLHPLYRGLYVVGRREVTQQGRWMAAVLAGGERAVLSHLSAAAHWGIWPGTPARIEVTTPRHRRSRPGLMFHLAKLPPDEVTVLHGIPITTVPRTIFDAAATEPRYRIERLMNDADRKRLTDPLSLPDLLSRYPRHRGNATVRAIVADRERDTGVTREELEHRFRAFIDEYDLPQPKINHHIRVGDRLIEADCVWPEKQLIVELDGRATHATPQAFESDRARDRALAVAGWRVIRVTWRQLHDDPDGLAADLRALLGLRAAA